jgi:hypothetical protein
MDILYTKMPFSYWKPPVWRHKDHKLWLTESGHGEYLKGKVGNVPGSDPVPNLVAARCLDLVMNFMGIPEIMEAEELSAMLSNPDTPQDKVFIRSWKSHSDRTRHQDLLSVKRTQLLSLITQGPVYTHTLRVRSSTSVVNITFLEDDWITVVISNDNSLSCFRCDGLRGVTQCLAGG